MNSSIWLGRRSEARVDFCESVRVIWPGEVSGVVARAVNLSPTGILVDALAAEAGVTARAWVSSVALDLSHADGVPRLVIDVLGHPRDPWDVPTPVVDTLQAVPEHVWEPEDVGATEIAARAPLDQPIE